MRYDPSEIQRLFLWRLIATRGEEWLKLVKPALKKSQRDQLVAAGFIETERRKDPETKGVGLYVTLLDAGWEWAKSNMDATLPARSTAGGQVLHLILKRLAKFLSNRNIDLTDALCSEQSVSYDAQDADSELAGETGSQPPVAIEPTITVAGLPDRIADACMKITRGKANVRIRLAELRHRLADVPRRQLDDELIRMSRDGKLTLYRLDNPSEIRTEDRDAELRTASGEPRHLVYFQ